MIAAEEGRPRRRFYHLTPTAERALADLRAHEAAPSARRPAAMAPT